MEELLKASRAALHEAGDIPNEYADNPKAHVVFLHEYVTLVSYLLDGTYDERIGYAPKPITPERREKLEADLARMKAVKAQFEDLGFKLEDIRVGDIFNFIKQD